MLVHGLEVYGWLIHTVHAVRLFWLEIRESVLFYFCNVILLHALPNFFDGGTFVPVYQWWILMDFLVCWGYGALRRDGRKAHKLLWLEIDRGMDVVWRLLLKRVVELPRHLLHICWCLFVALCGPQRGSRCLSMNNCGGLLALDCFAQIWNVRYSLLVLRDNIVPKGRVDTLLVWNHFLHLWIKTQGWRLSKSFWRFRWCGLELVYLHLFGVFTVVRFSWFQRGVALCVASLVIVVRGRAEFPGSLRRKRLLGRRNEFVSLIKLSLSIHFYNQWI